MAGSYQQTIILGTVGRDAESRFLQSGSQVTNFSVAVNDVWTDRETGERRESTTWYRCNAWGKQAELAQQYVRKGMQILVTGNVSASAYAGQDGEPKATLDLRVFNMQFVGSRSESQDGEEREAMPF